jgi:uncharacterized protein
MIAFWIAIFVYILYAQSQYATQQPQTLGRDGRRRARRAGRDRDDGLVAFPGGASDNWGGGGGWSGGGGGWSGGGGGFGGGGGSGSW